MNAAGLRRHQDFCQHFIKIKEGETLSGKEEPFSSRPAPSATIAAR
jgi:hypothetical protein